MEPVSISYLGPRATWGYPGKGLAKSDDAKVKDQVDLSVSSNIFLSVGTKY